MRFFYKIHSGFDGFSPERIPERLLPRNFLDLRWKRYIDVVGPGDEVWIYFHGSERFEPGVYIKGVVRRISTRSKKVRIQVRRSRATRPLTDSETSERVGRLVAPRGRQVFLFPDSTDTLDCFADTLADSCRGRMCECCTEWTSLPLIRPGQLGHPSRLPEDTTFVPAYWVIPSRCYLHPRRKISPGIRRSSDLFMRFKVGEAALAFPLALGIYQALRRKNLLDFDCIVPIPLSPDKARAGEIHRTRLLARELEKRLGVKTANVFRLSRPISKRNLRIRKGLSARQFEQKYAATLKVMSSAKRHQRILLIDDVCTEGSTLGCAIAALLSVNPDCEIVAATAGQMIVKAAVRHRRELLV